MIVNPFGAFCVGGTLGVIGGGLIGVILMCLFRSNGGK